MSEHGTGVGLRAGSRMAANDTTVESGKVRGGVALSESLNNDNRGVAVPLGTCHCGILYIPSAQLFVDRWAATSDWRSSSERGARVPTFIICIVMAARVRVKINGAENGKALVVRDGSARSETAFVVVHLTF